MWHLAEKKEKLREEKRAFVNCTLMLGCCCLVKQKSDGRGYPHGIRWHGRHRNPRPVGTVLNLVGTSNFKAIYFIKRGQIYNNVHFSPFLLFIKKLLFWKNLVGTNPNRPPYVPTGLHREQVSSCPVSCYSFVVSRIIFLHALHVSCAFCDVSMASRGFIRRLSLTIQERIT